MPPVNIKVIGPKDGKEYQAYLDTGAMKSLIPEKDAILLGLTYSGDMPLITGTGKDIARLYKASIIFLMKSSTFMLLEKIFLNNLLFTL